MTRPLLDLREDYDTRSIEKVERLLELLGVWRSNSHLESRLVLHGGTALNLFQLPRMTRLSVDVDLLYTGSAMLDDMLLERDEVIDQLVSEARLLGYSVGTPRASRDEHAGVSTNLAYRGDSIKVDLNFLDRLPLREWVEKTSRQASPPVRFRCMQPMELVARKVAAVSARVAMRDLYDLQGFGSFADDAHFRALATFYYSLADCFPQRKLGGLALDRFLGREKDLERDLYPMLPVSERPGLALMIDGVRPMLESLGELDDESREYLRLLDEEDVFRPELLFSAWPGTLERATQSPPMQWKLDNLRKRPRQVRWLPAP